MAVDPIRHEQIKKEREERLKRAEMGVGRSVKRLVSVSRSLGGSKKGKGRSGKPKMSALEKAQRKVDQLKARKAKSGSKPKRTKAPSAGTKRSAKPTTAALRAKGEGKAKPRGKRIATPAAG